MADFEKQTNSLMVRVIPIYLAAELLCPNLFWEGKDQWKLGGEERRRGVGCICHAKSATRLCREVYLIAAQLNSKNAGAVYELGLNKHCLCHKAN